MADAPYVGDLLKDSPSNWGRWGSDDEVGGVTVLGPGPGRVVVVVAGAGAVDLAWS